MTLKGQDGQSWKLSREHVQRLNFNIGIIGAGVDVTTVNLKLIDVKIILRRDGISTTLAHQNLAVLAAASMYFNAMESCLDKTAITLAANHKLIPLMVDLGGVINLFGNDELHIEVTSQLGWQGGGDSNQSYIEVENRPVIGVEYGVPVIEANAINGGKPTEKYSLGDFVSSVQLLNLQGGKDGQTANAVYNSLTLTSDKYACNENRLRLLARRAAQFETLTVAQQRGENFLYIFESPLMGAQITCEMQSSQVVAGENYILVRRLLVSNTSIARAEAVEAKHRRRNSSNL